jgi:hypothetical protein
LTLDKPGTGYSIQASGGGLSVTTSAFNVTASASVSGFVFVDTNADGVQETGEPILSGRTVFLDLKGDGTLDAGDPYAITDSTGAFTILVSPAGHYTLRLLSFTADNPTGPSAAGYSLNLSIGQNLTGENFGLRPQSLAFPIPVTTTPFGPPPSSDVNTAIVKGLYNLILGRPADAAGLANGVAMLNTGRETVSQIASNLYASIEYDTRIVKSLYSSILGRPADLSGLNASVKAMQVGWTETQVALSLISSSEFNVIYTSNSAFVQALYGDILGRQASTAEVNSWIQALNSGTSRSATAAAIFSSQEAYIRAIGADYIAFLGRPADKAGQNACLINLQTGSFTLDTMAEYLFGTAEFAARAKNS